jgi:hypothetical protein
MSERGPHPVETDPPAASPSTPPAEVRPDASPSAEKPDASAAESPDALASGAPSADFVEPPPAGVESSPAGSADMASGAGPWASAPPWGSVPHSRVIEVNPEPFDIAATESEEPAVPAGRSRTRKILLGSLLAVAAAGITAVGVAGWQIGTQKDATLVAPPEVAGLRLDQSDDGKATADYLQTALNAEVDLDNGVGAVYTSGDGRDVLFFGGTTLIWTPESDLDTAFGLIDDDQGAVENVHGVPAGHLGGTMKCGSTKTDDGKMAVCGWADHGSLALAMFPNRTEDDAAKLLLEIRDKTQSRD